MTFDEMEALRARLISLDCAFQYYKLKEEQDKFWGLFFRLNSQYNTDPTIQKDCEEFLASHKELKAQFDRDTL